MRYSILGCIFVMLGCGGQPEPKASAAPARTLSSLANGFIAAKIGPSVKTYTIYHGKALPAMTLVESTLAKRSIIADAGEGSEGIEIALEGVLCTLQENATPPARPKPADHDSLTAHGLTEAQANTLAATDKASKVACTADREMRPRSLPPLAEAAVEVLAELAEGWIHDHDTGRFWSPADWATARKNQTKYDPERAVPIKRLSMANGLVWLGTTGMSAFGRPDVALFPVPSELADAAEQELRAMSDLLLDETQVGPGMSMPMGAVDMLMIDYDAYARTVSATPPDVPPQGPYGRLAAIPPAAPVGDSGAFGAFVRRLTIR